MKLKIVHTADNHIGMRYSHISNPDVREKLVVERLESLKRIVSFANKEEAHFLVVAGDLFDKMTIPAKDLKDTGNILSKFEGEAVLIVPGNHDFYTDDDDSIWKKFKNFIDEKKVLILSDDYPRNFSVDDMEVNFFPAACRSKHSAENMIGWVRGFKKNPTAINIGIAHGNVEGLSLDNVDKYFTMTKQELKQSGIDFWLLGHIHVPFPNKSVSSNPGFFFSATHTPDGFDRKHSGHYWYIEVNEKKDVNAVLKSSDSFSFAHLEKTLNSFGDFEKLKTEIQAFVKSKTLLRLNISGRLDKLQIEEAEKYFDVLRKEFLHLERSGGLKIKIDKKFIDASFPNDSISFKLMSKLLEEKDNGLALQLCNELIESNNASHKN